MCYTIRHDIDNDRVVSNKNGLLQIASLKELFWFIWLYINVAIVALLVMYEMRSCKKTTQTKGLTAFSFGPSQTILRFSLQVKLFLRSLFTQSLTHHLTHFSSVKIGVTRQQGKIPDPEKSSWCSVMMMASMESLTDCRRGCTALLIRACTP